MNKFKKIKFIILPVCLIFAAAVALSGCNSAYAVPKNRCVVSVPEGVELWSKNAEDCILTDTPIRGVNREEGKSYYVVAKNTSFSVLNFEDYIYNEGTNGEGKVVTGFDVSGKVLPYSPSLHNEITLSCDENTDIVPVYQEFESVGLVVFVADDTPWESVFNLDNFFTDDGGAKEIENFYYLIRNKNEDSSLPEYLTPLPDFDTNFQVNEKEVNLKFATYSVERNFISEGQDILYCVLNRYSQTKYFTCSPVLGDGFPASLMGITMDIGKDYKLTVNFNDTEQ